MVYFSVEYDLGRRHRVVVGEQHLRLELTAAVAGALGALDDDEEVLKVVGVRSAHDTRHRVTLQCLCLFGNAWAWSLHAPA